MGLRLEDVTVYRGRLRVLENVSVQIEPGELVCISGVNGIGKSTLFEAVMGLCPVAKGKIFFGKRELTGLPARERASLGITLVPEGRRLFAGLTVRENLLLGAYSGKTDPHVLREMYDRFPVLERYQNRPAGVLSGGEGQQLALARALMSGPECLLLDEPTMGLSPKLTSQVFEEVRKLHTQGKTLLVSSQRIDKLVQKADRVYTIKGGRLMPLTAFY